MDSSMRLPPSLPRYNPPLERFQRANVIADLDRYQNAHDRELGYLNPDIQVMIDANRQVLFHETGPLHLQHQGGLLLPGIVSSYSVFGWEGAQIIVDRFDIVPDEIRE